MLLDQGRFAEAQRIVEGRPPDTPTRGIVKALLSARLRRARGDARGGRADSALTAEGAGTKPSAHLIYALLTAAEWRWADGDHSDADSLALIALRAAGLDSPSLSRSAHVGRAALVRARVAADRGDIGEAARDADRAIGAPANGYGPAHPLVGEARALRDGLSAAADAGQPSGGCGMEPPP